MIYVAFLRAINVGGTSVIKMADLAKAFEDMGFTNVRTYIQSGNVIFETKETDTHKLETKIEKALIKEFDTGPKVMVRTVEEFENIAKFIPFLKGQKRDAPLSPKANKGGQGGLDSSPFEKEPVPDLIGESTRVQREGGISTFSLDQLGDNTKLSLYVALLSREPNAEEKKLLGSFENEHEKFILSGKEIYCLIRKNAGKVGVYTKGTFEKKLGIPMTTRNYLTMGKMLEWYPSLRGTK